MKREDVLGASNTSVLEIEKRDGASALSAAQGPSPTDDHANRERYRTAEPSATPRHMATDTKRGPSEPGALARARHCACATFELGC